MPELITNWIDGTVGGIYPDDYFIELKCNNDDKDWWTLLYQEIFRYKNEKQKKYILEAVKNVIKIFEKETKQIPPELMVIQVSSFVNKKIKSVSFFIRAEAHLPPLCDMLIAEFSVRSNVLNKTIKELLFNVENKITEHIEDIDGSVSDKDVKNAFKKHVELKK